MAMLGGLVFCGQNIKANSLWAPDYNRPWQLTTYSEAAGLEQQRVFDVAFENDSTVWIAADDGLRRFDGYRWKKFGTNDGLPSSFLRAVMVNRQGKLWVGTDMGAGIFDAAASKYDPAGSATGLVNSNVREIDEAPDGRVWFSCDQWPDFKGKPGGLSCLANGRWQSFGRTNGLPMDYVIGYFQDSTGRQFVLTSHGWAQWQDNAWAPPANPGYEVEDCVLQMAEAADGTLFAQGEKTLLILKNGRWEPDPKSQSRLICRTLDGGVMAMECDDTLGRLWFSRWDGQQFVRVSADANYQPGGRFYHLRQAPDGSLWAVGRGTVVRWAYRDEHWAAFSQLPPPLGCDRRGRMWFADGTNLVLLQDNEFKQLPPGKVGAGCWNENGAVLAWNEERQHLEASDPDQPEHRTSVAEDLPKIDSAQADEGDGFWVAGRADDDEPQMVHYSHGHSIRVDAAKLRGWRVTTLTPRGTGELWLIAQKKGTIDYGLARVTDDSVEWQPLNPAPPPLAISTWMTGAGRNWLRGYAGLYEQDAPPNGEWRQVTLLSGGGFSSALMSSNEALFAMDGGRTGKPGCALFTTNGWTVLAGSFANTKFDTQRQKIFFASPNGVFIRKQPGTLVLEHLQAPGGLPVNVAIEDQHGDLWLGTPEGVLRYRPGHLPPMAVVAATLTEIVPGRPLPVTFDSVRRFEPQANPADFFYSWRVDDLAWSPFESWHAAALKLPELVSGAHRLQVRARDVDGNISLFPAELQFTVLPLPLQQRLWFYPLLGLVIFALLWLGWQRLAQLRKIARTNAALRQEITVRHQVEAELQRSHEQLEQRVRERTAALRDANEALHREIQERQQAEESRRQMAEQLHQAQKMEAIGTLAGGIAHDFNNALAVILLYCQCIYDEVAGQPELQEHLTEVLKAVRRSQNLVQQILTFSRRQKHEKKVVDLQPVIKEAFKLLRSVLPSTIEMKNLIESAPPVLADPTQIHQIVMNLCVNAQHALAGKPGRIEIQLGEAAVDEALCENHPGLHPGRYTRLAVRDTGCGMTPETLKRIFEPFFTTKQPGQGTGLGLAVVHGIVQSCDGAILVDSEVGRGTEFQIFLPAQSVVASAEPEAVPALRPTGSGHILLVDDETSITKVLERVLVRHGYRVSAFSDPRAALAEFQKAPADFDLMISDLTMPGMDGLELAKQVFLLRPEFPVVLATGYDGLLKDSRLVAKATNIRKTLQKPFNPSAILQTIAEIRASAAAK
jgi:signal transduction histidine kinase/ActR/RegA family two-component response regulator